MHEPVEPTDRAEAIALHRAMIIGALAKTKLRHGELAHALQTLSKRRYRRPGDKRTRTYGVSTLERWLYAYREGGMEALRPWRRKDAGRGRALTLEQRELLLDIRAEHRNASVPLILRTLRLAKVLSPKDVSPQTVRRLYRQAGLSRLSRAAVQGHASDDRQRLRWQTAHVCALWHGDVCHALRINSGTPRPMTALIHALLDDHSRYVVRLEVRPTEQELEMLEVLANAVREYGTPDTLYLDNGSTYRGDVLALVCERLGIHLLHPRARDPQARGKGERLFRTMREQCIDHIHGASTLHDVCVRLLAWREQYHRTPHASLMGRTPEQVWLEGTQSIEHQQREPVSEEQLRQAYVVHASRRVRKDSTLDVDGQLYEVDAAWLAGKTVTLVRSYLGPAEPHILFEDRRFSLHLADPLKNARRRRRAPKKREVTSPSVHFRPADAALDAMLGRPVKAPGKKGGDR
jgi:transposase InsO family protein